MSFDATTVNGDRFPSKKALKTLASENPNDILLTSLDMVGPQAGKVYRADEMPEGLTLQLAGPDPRTSRRWFANIRRDGSSVTVQ